MFEVKHDATCLRGSCHQQLIERTIVLVAKSSVLDALDESHPGGPPLKVFQIRISGRSLWRIGRSDIDVVSGLS